MKKEISKEEYNNLYAALMLIQALYKQGKVEKHVFKNILKEYSDRIDITAFSLVRDTDGDNNKKQVLSSG